MASECLLASKRLLASKCLLASDDARDCECRNELVLVDTHTSRDVE